MSYLRRSIDPRNQYRRWIDPRHGALRLSDVIAYLQRRGWKSLPPDRPGLLAFQEPTGESVSGKPVCPFVPDSEEYDNYAMQMFELITGLAEFEDCQNFGRIDDILGPAGPHDHRAIAAQRPGRQAKVAIR